MKNEIFKAAENKIYEMLETYMSWDEIKREINKTYEISYDKLEKFKKEPLALSVLKITASY